MDKNGIRNRIVVTLFITFFIMTILAYSIDNSMMFVICGFITILGFIRLLILLILFFRSNKRKQKQLNEIRNKINKTAFEQLYLEILDKKIDNEYKYSIIDINKFKLEFIYKDQLIELFIEPNYIIYDSNKYPIISITKNDLNTEINNFIKKIKDNIDLDYISNKEKIEANASKRRITNFTNYVKVLQKNIILLTTISIIFMISIILFLIYLSDEIIYNIIFISIFSLAIFIMLIQTIYSIKYISIYKKMLKDSDNNLIEESRVTSKKVRMIYMTNKKKKNNKYYLKFLILYTEDNKFIIPLDKLIIMKPRRIEKKFYNEINSIDHHFKYYKNSKVVISNNKIYEDIILKYFKLTN